MTVIIDGYKDTDLGLLPVEWAVENLDSICDILDSKRKPIKAADRSSGEYPYYGASGIIDWVTDYLFDEDLILLGEDGENIVSRNLPLAFRVSGKCWINNHAHVFRISDNNRDSVDFITMVLEAKDYSKLVVGSAQPKITQEQCKKLRLQRPPLPEQQKIADILTTVDDHISETEALIEKTKGLKQGLMQQLLTKGIGHTEFKDTEIGRIPVEWEVESADELFENVSIKNYPSERILTITQEFGAVYRDESGMDIQSSEKSWGSFKLVCPGNFVISLRSFQGGIEYSKLRGIVSPAYTVLKSKKIICEDYFRYYFKSSDFIHDLSSSVIGIRDGKQISFSVFSKISLPLPPLPEQHQIAAILTSVDDQIDTYQAKLTSLTRLKTGLMQQLLTGKIRVKV